MDDSAEPRPRPTMEGGDPVCWIDQVCPACGRLNGDEVVVCPSCGHRRDDDADR